MKKLILIAIIFTFATMYSQNELNIGFNSGVTIGDIKPRSPLALGLDVNYVFEVSSYLKVGPSLSGVYFITNKDKINNYKPLLCLPIGGAIRFRNFEDSFYFGLDAGFAVGILPTGDRGGIYFKPLIGYQPNENFKLNIFYAALRKRVPTYGYLGIGLVYSLPIYENSSF